MRLLSLFFWLGSGTVVTAIGALLTLPFRSVAGRWRRAMFRLLSSGTAWILGITVRVIGPLPRAPYLLVSNHLGYLDIFTMATVLPARFVAKREVRGWPIIGPLSWLLGSVYIHREQKRDALRVHDQFDDIVTGEDGAMIFPEATSSDGSRVLPFRPALLEWAAARTFPVHAATFAYRVGPGEPDVTHSVHWWGDMPFGGHFVNLARLNGIEATIRFASEPIASPDRKLLASQLHAAVSAMLTTTQSPAQ